MSLIREVPNGHGGTTSALCLANDPIVPIREVRRGRRVNAATDTTADLELSELADKTLTALASDPGVPGPLKGAAKAELRSRSTANDGALEDDEAEVGAAIAASHRSRSGIVSNMERLAKTRRGGVHGYV